MSLILEALRKPEAERRRGLPPDLRSELPPPAAVRTRHAPAWIALAVLAALALVASLWWSRPVPPPAAATSAGSVETADDARGHAGAAAPASARNDGAMPAPTPAPEPAPAPSGETSAASAPSAPAATVPAPPLATQAAAPSPEFPIDPVPARTAPAPPAVASPAAPAAPAAGSVTALADLDPETRKALPPLRVSMHMWNQAPAQRFAIVDGRRVAEGDRIGDATVARIEPDGLLLQWRGAAIRVPLR